MEYGIRKKVDNVKSFAISESECIMSSQNEIFDNSGKVLLESIISFQELKFEDPYFYVSDIAGNSFLLNPQIEEFKEVFIKKIINRNLILISKENAISVFSKDTKTSTRFRPFRFFKFIAFNDKIVFLKDKILFAYSILGKESLWRYDLSILGTFTFRRQTKENSYEVKKFIGLVGEELFVACSQGLILTLDIKTGVEIRRWQEFESDCAKYQQSSKGKLPGSELFQLSQDSKSLIALFEYYLIFIELASGEIKVHDLSNDLLKNSMKFYKGHYPLAENETHYFSTTDMDEEKMNTSFSYQALVSIRKDSLIIDWHYTDPEFDLGANMPQASADKLYIKTRKNTLFIFKREEG